jgi:excisionase family DNA binding protein
MVTAPEFWTVAEVATLIRVSKMSVYRLVHNGELDHKRIGRSIRIPDKSISTYFNIPPGSPKPARDDP